MKKIISHQLLKGKFNNLSLFIAIIIISLCSCTSKTEPYRILKFCGEASIYNYSRDVYLISYTSDSIHNGAILVKNGDLLAIADLPFEVSEQMNDSIWISNSANNYYFNDRLIAVRIGQKDTAVNIFRKMLEADLTGLSMLAFDSPVPDSALALLKDIAKIRPELSVNLGEDIERADSILKIIKPKNIIVLGATKEKLDIISRLSEPKMILADIVDSLTDIKMPAIPTLKQLIISMGKNLMPEKFLVENPQIERFTIDASGFFDFAEIKDLKMIKDLTIVNADSVANQGFLSDLISLESFSIYSKNFKFDPSLDNLRNLRWVTFSYATSQSDFERFIGKHPNLEVVEILDNKELTVVESLLSLKKLHGLILSENPGDSTSISQLKNLKYLSIPVKNLKDKKSLQYLQNSMPNTIIAANEGFCMGSGWLLLLFPLIIAFRFLLRMKTVRR